jgi:hypothetical protein
MPKQRILEDLWNEIDEFMLVPTLAFVVAVVFAIWIHFTKRGFGCRLAFLPISIVPLIMGVAEFARASIIIIMRLTQSSVGFLGLPSTLVGFSDIIPVIFWTCVQTSILLVIGCLLFLSKRGRPAFEKFGQEG